MPEYIEKYLDCQAEIEELERDYKGAPARTQFMLARRQSDMAHTHYLQSQNIHSVVASLMSPAEDYKVCSCGLKFKYSAEEHEVGGHLFKGEVTRQINVHLDEWIFTAYCQDCNCSYNFAYRRLPGKYGLPRLNPEKTIANHVCQTGENK